MIPSFSLVINHTPWVEERVAALGAMFWELGPVTPPFRAFLVNDKDHRGAKNWQHSKVEWALDQWEWAIEQDATHHVFMTDDLNIGPMFWDVLSAMVQANPDTPIGLLSNHPAGPSMALLGHHGYRTNSWLVGPAYVLPHACLVAFLAWYKSLETPDAFKKRGEKNHTELSVKQQHYFNDDSAINEWNTKHGGPGATWHPLPTIIEHRDDVESTVGHGDEHSYERVSWRQHQSPRMTMSGAWDWEPVTKEYPIDEMCKVEYWSQLAPMAEVK